MGRIDDEIEYDEYELDRLNETPSEVMNDEEMRYYWYIQISNLYGGRKPAAE